jgi:predicted amidohydrolase YtcJ
MNIYHGDIVTCNRKGTVASYLVEDGGKITYVGDDPPNLYSRSSRVIELGSKALLPAFGDGHIHFSNWALFNGTFDVRFAASLADVGEIVSRYAASDRSAKVLFGFGHTIQSVEEKRLITRSELDAAVKERPVYLVCLDGHSAVANTAAIGLMPQKIRALHGFDLVTGQLFHEAFLAATDFISGKVPVPRLLSYILKGVDTLAAYGIGLIHTVEGIGFPRDMDVDMVRFVAKGVQPQFRIYFQTMAVEKALKRKLPRIGGCFACALDGAFGSKDAALLEPYSNDPENSGILFYSDEQVTEFVKKANRAGLQVQMHCYGDAAIVQAVKAIEAALADFPRTDHRHTLVHACLTPPQVLEKIAALGIGLTIQPGFLTSDLEPPDYLQAIIGDRIKYYWPLKTIQEMGIIMGGGSDGPVTIPNPIEGIYGACNNPVQSQALSIADALRMYTYNVAYTTFDEQERGSLEEGKLADMIVLNKNPLQLASADLKELKVEKMYLAGEEYKPGKKMPQVIIDSLKNRSRPL